MAPLIGITGWRRKGRDVLPSLDIYADNDFEVHFADYAEGVVEAGGLPVHVTPVADPAALVARLDGLILSGGPDVAPDRYGQVALDTTSFDAERDAFELALAAAALDRGLPLLGICRGLQVLNVAGGGTLHQHIDGHARFDRPADHLAHEVRLDSSSTLGGLVGERLEVNSLHHQSVDELGAGWRAVGWADDGTIEAMEHTDERAMAVQWHAEKLATRATDPVFAWLTDRAG